MRPDGGSSQQVQQELQRKYHGMQLLLNGRYYRVVHLHLQVLLPGTPCFFFHTISYCSIRTSAPK